MISQENLDIVREKEPVTASWQRPRRCYGARMSFYRVLTEFLLASICAFTTLSLRFNGAHNACTGGGRVVRWCWVNFQCRGVLLIWIIVGQGPIALAVSVGGGCLDIFFSLYPFSPLSPSLWETARYRLKYCLKGPLNPQNNQCMHCAFTAFALR